MTPTASTLRTPESAIPGAQPVEPPDADLLLQRIDAELDRRLGRRPDRPPRLLEAMRYAVLGPGKRLRPRLALLAAEAVGGDPHDALPAACAVEFIHAYSLAHDDLPAMDDDELRRGRPTVHKQFDEATAILVGDALQALAFESVVETASPQRVAWGCRVLAEAVGVGGLVGGQADDLDGAEPVENLDKQRLLDQLERIHSRKTGRLITASLRLGAIAAGGEAEDVEALGAFGERLGLLFQVTDDLLDAAGDAAAVGKRVGKDQDRGKLTYPLVLGIEATREYAEKLAGEAAEPLARFGERATKLGELTRAIAKRDR